VYPRPERGPATLPAAETPAQPPEDAGQQEDPSADIERELKQAKV